MKVKKMHTHCRNEKTTETHKDKPCALSMALEITAANVFLAFTFTSFCSKARSPYAGHSRFCIHHPPASAPSALRVPMCSTPSCPPSSFPVLKPAVYLDLYS